MFNLLNFFNSLLLDNKNSPNLYIGDKSDIYFLLVKYYSTYMEFETHIKIYSNV